MKKSNKKALEAFNHEEDLRLQNAPAEIESLESQIQEITGIIAEAQLRLDEFAAQNILHRNYHDPAIIYIILTYFETGAVDTIKEAVNKYDNESRLDAINEKLEKLNNKIDQALDELDKMKVKLNEILERLNRQNSKMDEMNASLKGILRNSAISAAASSALLMIEKDREWRRR
jgi:archaellum component FlaC